MIEFWVSRTLIEKWGRRGLGILGYSGILASKVIMHLRISYFNLGVAVTAAKIIFTASTLFLVFLHIGGGGVGWILQGESLNPHFRVTGAGIMAACDWIPNGMILLIFPYWKAAYGLYSLFAFERVLAILSVIFVLLMVPETKGKNIEQMDQVNGRPIGELRKQI